MASFLDKPATAPQLLLGAGASYKPGETGYVTNVEGSLPAAEMALYQPEADDRQVDLVIEMQEAAELNLEVLQTQIEQVMANDGQGLLEQRVYPGLQTGEELAINATNAISGVEHFEDRYFCGDVSGAGWGRQTSTCRDCCMILAVQSSNFAANLLLHEIAGEANTYLGAELLTESMHRLGLIKHLPGHPVRCQCCGHPSQHLHHACKFGCRADFRAGHSSPNDGRRHRSAPLMIYHCSKGAGRCWPFIQAKLPRRTARTSST